MARDSLGGAPRPRSSPVQSTEKTLRGSTEEAWRPHRAPLPPAPPQSKLSELEVLALLIAALSHDLDHRGVNNSYIQR